MTIFHFCHQILSNLHRRFGTHSLWGFGPGMKGMGQVAAGSTRLIQQGNVLISEMESLPKRNLLLGACQQLVPDRSESAVSAIATKPKLNLLPWCLKSW